MGGGSRGVTGGGSGCNQPEESRGQTSRPMSGEQRRSVPPRSNGRPIGAGGPDCEPDCENRLQDAGSDCRPDCRPDWGERDAGAAGKDHAATYRCAIFVLGPSELLADIL